MVHDVTADSIMTRLEAEQLAMASDEEITQYAAQCCAHGNAVSAETLTGNWVGHLAMHHDVVVPALHRLDRRGRTMDFACGAGRLSLLMGGMGFRQVVGVDSSCAALARAAQVAHDEVFVRILGDGTLPFPPECFDNVVSMIAIQHIQFFPVRWRYFREFRRVLRPDGRLLIQVNADDRGPDIGWFERGRSDRYVAPDCVTDEAELERSLLAAGFQPLEMWRTPMDTVNVSWETNLTGRKDGWLWVLAAKGEPADAA